MWLQMGDNECSQNFIEKSLEKPRKRWKYYFNIDVREISLEDWRWKGAAWNRVYL